jgi:hypothetical protein
VHCGDACDVASLLQRSQQEKYDAILINPRTYHEALSFSQAQYQCAGPSAPPSVISGSLTSCLICCTCTAYIPNPESAAGLETFGDGGWSGEELTAAAVSQSVSLLRPRNGILAVVANLPNVDEYPQKLARWWADGTDTALDSTMVDTAGDKHGLHATVLHGCKWSPQQYAELIHMYSSTAGVDNYARALERSGVKDVCNGFVFARRVPGPADCQAPTVACLVAASHDQVWQAVAGACGHSVARQVQTAASKACGPGSERVMD